MARSAPARPAMGGPAARRGSWHHGDLKRALVEAALATLRERGGEAVSLREVARRAGVSAAAPYHHFASREALLAARRAGTVRAVTGRASDFFGPGGVNTYFEGRFFRPVLAGKRAAVPVNPDAPHTYHFIPDVAAGLAALGRDPGAEGTFMLPCRPAVTTRELCALLGKALGRPVAISRIPPLALKLLGLGMPILRELGEMAYQWEEPFLVDDARFRARYGDIATPLPEAARLTAAWGEAAFGPGARKVA